MFMNLEQKIYVQICALFTLTGADWPSGEPGEFPVAWQPIWPATLYFFKLLFLPAECILK